MILLQTGFAQQDSTRAAQNTVSDSVYVMQKSPLGAVLRSAIIPGWGQIYNHSYFKAPIIWGVAAWLIYNWNLNNNYYKDYQSLYDQAVLENNEYLIKGYKSIRNSYHDQRDLFAIYMGLTYFLNLVDAYVDAQLFDFNVNENYRTGEPMLGIKIKF